MDKDNNLRVSRILDLSAEDPGLLRELERFRRPVAVLFADIAGSTTYYERFGDAAGLAMVHRVTGMVRVAVEAVGGRVIKNIGDGIMARFDECDAAVRAAIAIQRELRDGNEGCPEDERINVRMGLHYGMAISRSDHDVFGNVVNVASRIQSLALPGQIFVSDKLQEKLSPDVFDIVLVGQFALAGRSEERSLFEVRWQAAGTGATESTGESGAGRLVVQHLNAEGVVVAQYEASAGGLSIGRDQADVTVPASDMEAPHARFVVMNGEAAIEDISGRGGVFVQIAAEHPLQHDDLLRMGSQFFRFLREGTEGTRAVSASQPARLGGASLMPLNQDGSQKSGSFLLEQSEVHFGRVTGDYVFAQDPFMSRSHARIFRRGDGFFVQDLASRNGTFVNVRGQAVVPVNAVVWIRGEVFRVVAG